MSKKKSDEDLLNFKTEKDFQLISEKFLEPLNDLSILKRSLETEWKKRIEAMSKIQQIIMGNSAQKYPSAFSSFLIKVVIPLSTQVFTITFLDIRFKICHCKESRSNHWHYGSNSG